MSDEKPTVGDDLRYLRNYLDGDSHVAPKKWDPYQALERIEAALRDPLRYAPVIVDDDPDDTDPIL
jgi:hypothetical protein